MATAFFAVAICPAATGEDRQSAVWPQWRGPEASGRGNADADVPLKWSDDDHVVWSAEIDGLGGSTPAVMGDTAYLTSGVEQKNTLMAISLSDGSIRWSLPLGTDAGNKHRKGGGSNPSPVVGTTDDGSPVVVVYFRSGDVAGVSANGEKLWHWNLQERFGDDTLWWDLGSSPALIDGDPVLAVVQTGPSYLIRLDLETGDVVWKADRDVDAPEEAAQTYSTPIEVQVGDRTVIAMLGADHLTLHDTGSGDMLATLGGFNPTGDKYFRSISSPVASGCDIVFPYARGETITLIDAEKLLAVKQPRATINDSPAVRWHVDWIGSDVPTPAVDDRYAYVVDDSKAGKGTVAALTLSDGKPAWKVQLPKSRHGYSSSPLLYANHLFVTREDGLTHVIGPIDAPEPKLVSDNALSDDEPYTVASPVPVDGGLLIRTRHRLYRIGTGD